MGTNAKNNDYIKSYNRCLILRTILKKPLSRADIAEKTGLTRAAVTNIIENMIKIGVVKEIGKTKTRYGRKPILLDINPDSKLAFGLDINRVGCNLGIVNIKGDIKEKTEIPHGIFNTADETLDHIIKLIDNMISINKIDERLIIGIGVSSPGPLDVYNGTILNPPNFNMWHGIDIFSKFKKKLPYNVYLENNATSLTLYEKNFGKGSKISDFCLIGVTTGVGAGIVINNQLYRGAGGFGSEIGHTTINIEGQKCTCGNRGCLELYTSIPAIVKYASTCGIYVHAWKEIVDKAIDGDKECESLIEREAKYLSAGIINLINILETKAIILSGDISYKPEILINKIRENVFNTVITRNIHKVQIFGGEVGENIGILSAASIVFDNYIFRNEQ